MILRKSKFLFLIAFFVARRAVAADPSKYSQWMMNFYKDPDVPSFRGFWSDALSSHRLEDQNQIAPFSAFTAQVLHQYPRLLAADFSNLNQYSNIQRSAILRILWLSDTKEANGILRNENASQYLNQPPAPIEKHPISDASDLDFCWGYYFATGSTKALIPVIAALDYVKYVGSISQAGTSATTTNDTNSRSKEIIFRAARWSLFSNAKEDLHVAQFLDQVYRDGNTPIPRRRSLRPILPSLFPQRYELIDPTKPMTKVVYHIVGPQVQPGSFTSKSKTLYRYGKTIGRVDEAPDPSAKLQALTISNGPDIFLINLWDNTGRHIIDQSPTCFFHAPVVPPTDPHKPLRASSFEFGLEMDFMRDQKIKAISGNFQGNRADLYTATQDGLILNVYTRPGESQPLGVSVFDGNTEVTTIVYDEYKPDLPAARALFWPPPGVTLSIAKAQ